ncbi:MAG: hypothetical protein SGI71_04545 [Verrucomicrobiota bacterium]|nr:hypothetical protein [Verrucomicrobiota bacterium]
MPNANKLTAPQIVAGLNAIAKKLEAKGIKGEIAIYGGAAMVLAFNARPATKDVDAIFAPAVEIREAAKQVGEELGFPDGWLNDGVKAFVSQKDRREPLKAAMLSNDSLIITTATAEYLLAMKCMAGRIDSVDVQESQDIKDIRFLADRLGIETSDQILDLVGEYYKPSSIPTRTVFLIQSLYPEIEGENALP